MQLPSVCLIAWAFVIGWSIPGVALAGENQTGVPSSQPSARPDTPRDWYVPSRAASTKRKSDPVEYLRPVNELAEELGVDLDEDFSWLDFGIQQRTRFEHRDDFYRADLETDDRFLLRTRGYVGVRKILDPLRLGFEFQDSRQFQSRLSTIASSVDEADVLQAFGELHFADAAGKGQPLSFRMGRMSFDVIDRRLVTRNGFGNTTNSFDGFRLRIGETRSPWELDVFAMQPVERRSVARDRTDEERWLYGTTGHWRRWSPWLTLEPFYFILDEDHKPRDAADREIHTLGVHGYGLIGESGFDYDVNATFQFGSDGDRTHRAFATHAELGYTFDHKWKPRVAAWVNYASGDRDPDDNVSGRFDKMFGSSHTFYSHSDLFTWQNTINPAVRLSARPTSALRLDAFYRAYWLASDTDAWVRADRLDPTGDSGRFVGHEIDLRARWKLTRHLELDVGYSHFMPGAFASNTGPFADDSDFFYVGTVLRP